MLENTCICRDSFFAVKLNKFIIKYYSLEIPAAEWFILFNCIQLLHFFPRSFITISTHNKNISIALHSIGTFFLLIFITISSQKKDIVMLCCTPSLCPYVTCNISFHVSLNKGKSVHLMIHGLDGQESNIHMEDGRK